MNARKARALRKAARRSATVDGRIQSIYTTDGKTIHQKKGPKRFKTPFVTNQIVCKPGTARAIAQAMKKGGK